METVSAIRNVNDIQAIKDYLIQQSERDYLLFVFGINTGLKVSELTAVKKDDLLDENGNVAEFYHYSDLDERRRSVYINKKLRLAITEYLKKANSDMCYLFQSRKFKKPITRQQAYRIIHDAAVHAGVNEKIGTNSLAKTFGYHAYKKGVSLALLQKHFHHATPSETLKFLGIKKDEQIVTQIDVNL